MRRDGPEEGSGGHGVTLKAVLAAVAIGMALPVPHNKRPPLKSQIATFELGRG